MSQPKLIVQLPFADAADYDFLLQVEESLFNAFAQRYPFGEINGHDEL